MAQRLLDLRSTPFIPAGVGPHYERDRFTTYLRPLPPAAIPRSDGSFLRLRNYVSVSVPGACSLCGRRCRIRYLDPAAGTIAFQPHTLIEARCWRETQALCSDCLLLGRQARMQLKIAHRNHGMRRAFMFIGATAESIAARYGLEPATVKYGAVNDLRALKKTLRRAIAIEDLERGLSIRDVVRSSGLSRSTVKRLKHEVDPQTVADSERLSALASRVPFFPESFERFEKDLWDWITDLAAADAGDTEAANNEEIDWDLLDIDFDFERESQQELEDTYVRWWATG